ncbi:MAG: type II toxin-antitoxin system RelE/ParE family toxin [bacterium]
MIVNEKNLIPYSTENDRQPFLEWIAGTDRKTRMMVLTRLQRVRLGNFGDCPFIKGANSDLIRELRFFDPGGTRIYIRENGKDIILFLVAGDKDSQNKDISKAKEYWQDYKFRNPLMKETIFDWLHKINKGGKNEKI